MILSTSAFYERANLGMTNLRKQMEDIQVQIASGQRINKSSDDPVAAARLRELARAETLATVNVANANRALADLTLADSAMQEIAENIIRVQALTTQAATGTLSDMQRAAIGEQISNIRGNLIALTNSKDSTGHALFGGESAGDAYTLDGAGNPVYSGTTSSEELPLGDGQSVIRGVIGPDFLNFEHAGTQTDLFAVLGNLAAALSGTAADSAGVANQALDALNTGLEKVTTNQTVIGARMNWVDLNLARNERQGELRESEKAERGGVDAARAITQMQQLMTVLEASQASFVKLSSMSLFSMMR